MSKKELCRYTSVVTVRPVSKNGDCKCQCYDRLFCGQVRRVYFINYKCYDCGQFCVKKKKKRREEEECTYQCYGHEVSVANRVDGVVQVKITRGLHSERWKKERKKKRKEKKKKRKQNKKTETKKG